MPRHRRRRHNDLVINILALLTAAVVGSILGSLVIYLLLSAYL